MRWLAENRKKVPKKLLKSDRLDLHLFVCIIKADICP